jgi:hypothetical protein
MEPPEEIPALRIPPSQVGLIKEAPVRRWLRGQGMWDERFKRRSKKAFREEKEAGREGGRHRSVRGPDRGWLLTTGCR